MTQTRKQKDELAAWADAVSDAQPITDTITCGRHKFTVRELDGRERFEAAEKADDSRWDLFLWMLDVALISPRPKNAEELESLRPEWITELVKKIMALSGMTLEEEQAAGKESASVTDIGTS